MTFPAATRLVDSNRRVGAGLHEPIGVILPEANAQLQLELSMNRDLAANPWMWTRLRYGDRHRLVSRIGVGWWAESGWPGEGGIVM